MSSNTELQIISYLFNHEVFSANRPYLDEVQWNTPIAKALVKKMISTNGTAVVNAEPVVIKNALSKLMTESEAEKFLKQVISARSVKSPHDVNELKNAVFSYIRKSLLYTALMSHKEEGDSESNDLFNKLDRIPKSLADSMNAVNLTDIDVEGVLKSDLGVEDIANLHVLPSNFDVVKKASAPFGGYIPGQVVLWCGKPGGGKSAMMLQEAALAAASGSKVLWLAMGDLSYFDFMSRLSSVVTGEAYDKVVVKVKDYFPEVLEQLDNNFDLIIEPADTKTVDDLVALIERSETHYSLVVIDYDSNFKHTQTDSGMYERGEEVYNKLTQIAKNIGQQRVVFVAGQPKIAYWNDLLLTESTIGESSRKQHIVDMILTLGTANAETPAGLLHIAKMRRGKVGGTSPVIMDTNGRFEEVDRAQLDLIRKYVGKP